MNDVTKAAERLAMCESAYPSFSLYDEMDDARLVARWALPLLDETPIDHEWLESVGFKGMGEALMYGVLGGLSSFAVHPTPVTESKWTLKTRDGMYADVPPPATRGAVRMLCLSLGITLTEPAAERL